MTLPRKKHLLGIGIPVGAVACMAIALAFLNSGPSRPVTGDALFSIDRGENLADISGDLQRQGFIRYAPLLDILARVMGTQSEFKAGYYRIPARAGTLAIHDLLVYGSQKLTKVTIPEGWTTGKIARHLEALGVSPAGDFLAAVRSPVLLAKFGISGRTMEGYLFPETYFVPVPFTGAAMAELMATTFFDTVGKIEPGWKGIDGKAVYDTVIMASIVCHPGIYYHGDPEKGAPGLYYPRRREDRLAVQYVQMGRTAPGADLEPRKDRAGGRVPSRSNRIPVFRPAGPAGGTALFLSRPERAQPGEVPLPEEVVGV
jgi:hypothetical protein